MNEKHSIMSPFDITSKLLGPYVFSATSREMLGEKWSIISRTILLCPFKFLSRYDSPSPLANYSDLRLFFVNLQENYLKTQPTRVRNLDRPEKMLKELQLMERAAASISDGVHLFTGSFMFRRR